MDRSELRARIANVLAAHEAVSLALLFGSRARGDARAGSDVDIAVIGAGIDVLGLAATLTESLGLTVDVVDVTEHSPIPLRLAVVTEGVPVFERHPGAYGRFLSHTLADLETDLPAYRRMNRAFVDRVARHGLTEGT